jgi:hypothetical protein
MATLRRLSRGLGIALQVLVLGELLFIAVATMYAMQTGAQVFRYAGF